MTGSMIEGGDGHTLTAPGRQFTRRRGKASAALAVLTASALVAGAACGRIDEDDPSSEGGTGGDAASGGAAPIGGATAAAGAHATGGACTSDSNGVFGCPDICDALAQAECKIVSGFELAYRIPGGVAFD